MVDLFKIILDVFFALWWIWLPIFLYWLFFTLWLAYARQKYWQSIEWTVLEIIPPKEVEGSPKPFEQIFSGLYGLVGTVDTFSDVYFKGIIQNFFSLEIVGIEGKIHFLIRFPSRFRNLIEAQFYAQYPHVEIREFEDYVNNVPAVIPNKEWDLWGTKLLLSKPDPYPIRTYPQFLEISGEEQKRFIDPLSSLMEVMSKLKVGEQIWVQILCRPADNSWRDEGKKILDKMLGKVVKKKKGFIESEIEGWSNLASDTFSQVVLGVGPSDKKEERVTANLASGEQEVVKAIELNITKTGFDTKIGFVYIAKKDILSKVNVSGTFGAFSQFNTLNLNGFKLDKATMTVAKGHPDFIDNEIKRFRKMTILRLFKERSFWEKGYVLNLEELATIFHFPATAVVAPRTPRIETKTGVPPNSLPIAR